MEYVVEIEKLDHQGRGICFTDGIITFVPNTLIGEKVKIKVIKNNKKIREAVVVNLLEKSNKRIDVKCNNLCGGCNLLHMSYEDELIYKENKVKEIINKFTDLNINVVKKIIPNNECNYRNKATFQVKENIGFYKEKSYEIVPINECLLVDEKINKILKCLKQLNLNNVYQIVVRTSKNYNETMVVFKIRGKFNTDISLLKKIVDTVVLFDNEYKVLYGNGYIVDKIGNYSFVISPDSFFQVNTNGAYNLYSKVLEYVENSNYLLDLYCGTGTIGIFLSNVCNKVLGVEINKFAVKDAIKNKELNKINNINFICKDASLFNEIDSFDTIVVDPPRSGLDKNTINYLLKISSKKIVYVSCDPVTLARDINLLNEKYDCLEITPVDMFSRTYHVECVSVLHRKSLEK